jgi:hypothetical protein
VELLLLLKRFLSDDFVRSGISVVHVIVVRIVAGNVTWDPDEFDKSRPNGVVAQTDPGSGTCCDNNDSAVVANGYGGSV